MLSIGLPSALLPFNFQPDLPIASETSFVVATLLSSVTGVTAPVVSFTSTLPKSTLTLTVELVGFVESFGSMVTLVPTPSAKFTISV